MKRISRYLVLGAAVYGTALILSAWSKKEEPAKLTASEAQKSADNLSGKAQKQAAAVAAQSQMQSLMDRAKSLVAEKKYPEALSSLNELSKLQLTKKWSFRVVGQDIYDSEPAAGKKNNNLRLIAGTACKF